MSFLLIVLMTFFSCKKKVIENNILIPHEAIDYVDCNCPNYILPSNTPLEEISGETQYRFPQINPNNPDEIAFISAPYGNGHQSQIVIYNSVTQGKKSNLIAFCIRHIYRGERKIGFYLSLTIKFTNSRAMEIV